MDEKVKVTDTEQTDKKVNEDTTLKEKLVEAEYMEADMPEQSEEQDGTGAEETTSYLPLAADQLDLAKQYKQMMLFYEAGIRQLTDSGLIKQMMLFYEAGIRQLTTVIRLKI